MMRPSLILALVATMALLAIVSATNVATGEELMACLEATTPLTDTCTITASSITLPRGPAVISTHRTITSSLASSRILLAGHGLAYYRPAAGTGGVSLSVTAITMTMGTFDVLPAGQSVFEVANAPLSFTNGYVYGVSVGKSFIYAESAEVSLSSLTIQDITLANGWPALFLQDSQVTLVNTNFRNVPSYSSRGVVHLNNYLDTDYGSSLVLGGEILFDNCPQYDSSLSGNTAFGFQRSAGSGPFAVSSQSSNPADIVLTNSPISLFLDTHNTSGTLTITVSTITVDNTNIAASSNADMAYIFNLQPGFTPYGLGVMSPTAVTHITVLRYISSIGMGIVSRGHGAPTGNNPTDLSSNPWLQVSGSITATHTADISSTFRLVWPMDITAASISTTLTPRSSDNKVAQFLHFQDNQLTSSQSAQVSFTLYGALSVSSVNTQYAWPQSASPTSSAPSAPSSASSYPSSDVAPIYLNVPRLDVSITAYSISLRNFSLPRSSTYNAAYRGAAISVLSGNLALAAVNGAITLSGHQNVAGRGGAVYVSGSSNSQLTLTTPSGRNIVLSDNIAYYGGAIFVEPTSTGGTYQFASGGSTQLVRNLAIGGGGAALLPHSFVTELFPASKTSFDGNAASEFGCIFAFGLTSASSDTNEATCTHSYLPTNLGTNYRIGTGYTYATFCTDYESICDPLPIAPITPITPPVEPPVAPITPPIAPITPPIALLPVEPPPEPISPTPIFVPINSPVTPVEIPIESPVESPLNATIPQDDTSPLVSPEPTEAPSAVPVAPAAAPLEPTGGSTALNLNLAILAVVLMVALWIL